MNISLSIITPCFNSGFFLDDCVKSILRSKTRYMVEVVIVDDGSNDAITISILDFYSKENRVVVEKIAKNKGVQNARNVGVAIAKGNFLMMLDSDDLLIDNIDGESYIDEAIDVLQKNEDIAFVHCFSGMFDGYHGLTISSYPLNETLIISKHHVPIFIIYRKSDIQGSESYLVSIKKWQDWSFGIKLLSNRWNRNLPNLIHLISKAHHKYRVHDKWKRISYSKIDEKEMTKITVEDCFNYFTNFYGGMSSAEIVEFLIATKPSKFDELCYIASHDVDLARRVIRERRLKLELSKLDEQIP